MMVAQASFVPAQAFSKMGQCDVEGGLGLVRFLVSTHIDSPPDVHADRRANTKAFARHNDGGVDGVCKILFTCGFDRTLDMEAQRVTHVDLLSCYGYLQSKTHFDYLN